MNREGILLDEPRGYYREYTVVTPGSTIAARGGSWPEPGASASHTDDHYESFRRIGR